MVPSILRRRPSLPFARSDPASSTCRRAANRWRSTPGVRAAHGDVLVFADARQSFAPAALTELVSNFADPSVGGRHRRADPGLRAGREQRRNLPNWRRRRTLLEVREMDPPQREPRLVHARRDRRHLRAPALTLDSAAAGDAARRRAGADARGAGRLPDRVRGARDRFRPQPAPTRRAKRGAKHERWPATTRSSRSSHDCCFQS